VAAGVPARLASPAVRGELGVAEGSPIGADVAKSDEPSSAARQIGERAVEIREHLEQTYRAMFGTASELPKKPPEPTVPPAPPPPVTLRVTLLPPPAATQPGAQSRPSTADPDKP
jgi:hypothetical protein